MWHGSSETKHPGVGDCFRGSGGWGPRAPAFSSWLPGSYRGAAGSGGRWPDRKPAGVSAVSGGSRWPTSQGLPARSARRCRRRGARRGCVGRRPPRVRTLTWYVPAGDGVGHQLCRGQLEGRSQHGRKRPDRSVSCRRSPGPVQALCLPAALRRYGADDQPRRDERGGHVQPQRDGPAVSAPPGTGKAATGDVLAQSAVEDGEATRRRGQG